MSRPALIPYVGKPSARPKWRRGDPAGFRKATFEKQGENLHSIGQVPDELRLDESERALALFRAGNDSVSIASLLGCTPAAAANALARIRDAQR